MIRFLGHTLRPIRLDDDGPIDYWLIYGPDDPDCQKPPIAGPFDTQAEARASITETR